MEKPVIEKVVRPRASVRSRLKEIWIYRELLVGMIRKELKVKYKNSVLGFLWTMVNPALYIVVFWLVFTQFLPNGIPDFVVYFISGLLVWNLFTGALNGATGSIVGNAGIVKKVYFPREILPISSVGASVVHYFLQTIVLIVALIALQHNIDWGAAWLLPYALITLIIFASALGIFLSAVNVYSRDTQHLLELILLAWFWMTPIIYSYASVLQDRGGLIAAALRANPVTMLILPFQRVIYNDQQVKHTETGEIINALPLNDLFWYFKNISIVLIISLIFLYFAFKIFDRAQGNFAEEL